MLNAGTIVKRAIAKSGILLVLAFATDDSTHAQPPITALAFAPSGKKIVAGSQAGIAIRNWPSLSIIKHRAMDFGRVQDLQFSPDGTHLMVAGGKASESGTWRVIQWPDLVPVASSTKHADMIHSTVWLSQDRFITGAADNEVIDWRWQNSHSSQISAKILRRLTGHSRRVLSVDYLSDAQLIVSAGVDQSIRTWNIDENVANPKAVLDNHTGIVRDIARRPGTHTIPYLASGSSDKSIRIWQPSIGRLVRFARLTVEPLAIAWSLDGMKIGVGCVDGKLRVVDANTVEVEQVLHAIDGWAYSVLAAPDGSFAVGGSNGMLVRIMPASTPN